MAATLVLEPIFEADFHPCSYGFRPKRNATQALETFVGVARKAATMSSTPTFATTSVASTTRTYAIGRAAYLGPTGIKLLRQWLRAGVMEDGGVHATVAGLRKAG